MLQRDGERSQHGMLTFIVGIEDDVFVALVWCGERLPELLEACCVGDNLVVVAAVVVGNNHGVRFLVRDIFNRL